MTDHDGTIRNWRKSSYSSGGNGSCVEVGSTARVVAVRDTTDRSGGTLLFDHASWAIFTEAL